MTNVGIILAGGVGSRVGRGMPKQFIEVLGKPVIAYTIDIYQRNPNIDFIEIVCLESHIDKLKSIVEKYGYTKVRWICPGGSDFQHSVINGVYNLKDDLQDDDIVLVHYAAAPFTSDYIIDDSIRVSKEKGNSVSATPCLLLLGKNENGESRTWVDRDDVIQLNGPQGFKYGYVKQLYDEAISKDLLDKVEPHTTTLMFYMGRTIYFAKGDQTNLKITTEDDLTLFEGYVIAKKLPH